MVRGNARGERQDSRTRVLMVLALVLAVGLVVGSPAPTPASDPSPANYVPAPLATTVQPVTAGGVYPFPWTGKSGCARAAEPGCFQVQALSPEEAVIVFTHFEGGAAGLKASGFRYRTRISPAGSEYDLFALKGEAGRETWIYAVLMAGGAEGPRLAFLQYPAFVTERASLAVQVTLDLKEKVFQEVYSIHAEEPITLIGLWQLEQAMPVQPRGVTVNGHAVSFPYARIRQLNLPAGRHTVIMEAALRGQPEALTLPGTAFEPRKMFLIRDREVRIRLGTDGPRQVRVSLLTMGLPEPVWARFRDRVSVDPVPASRQEGPLSLALEFGPIETIRVTAPPRIALGKSNYPVILSLHLLREPAQP